MPWAQAVVQGDGDAHDIQSSAAMDYWREIFREAWSKTKRITLPRILGSVATMIATYFAQYEFSVRPLVTTLYCILAGLIVYAATTAIDFLVHVGNIPPSRERDLARSRDDKDVEIARQNAIMAGPEIPLPSLDVQANYLWQLLMDLAANHHHRDIWLSQIFAFKESYKWLPPKGQVNWPEALRQIIFRDSRRAQILNVIQRPYPDFDGKVFYDDYQIHIGT